MNLTRFDPFRELDLLTTRLNRMLGPTFPQSGVLDESMRFGDWSPAMDVEETEKEYVVKADLPAIPKEDVKVRVEDGVLTVEGERKQEKEEKGKKYHRTERSYGKFVRRLALPSDVDQQQIAAECKDGVLLVRLPKKVAAAPKAVDVKIA
ncbi:MAG: Hsp20/alpha crystallin family protein [Acidobacteria bacterium]|nr:Hsp20/alpha crystallin family protein [Acidobacteriota bacterium]